MNRRDFLLRSSLTLGTAATLTLPHARTATAQQSSRTSADQSLQDWESVRAHFQTPEDIIQMSAFYLAAHPRCVREAIERHRRGLDQNPMGYMHEHQDRLQDEMRDEAAKYLGVRGGDDIAFTDSTTMGLGLLYGGLKLNNGQEILTTEHDHYSTHTSLQHRADRLGTPLRKARLYAHGGHATEDEIVSSLRAAISPRTRIVAVTWVHSSTGVKLPIRAMADALAEINRDRDEAERALLCVDGVHGLGVENVTMPDLGCDFFIAGTHKWLCGPRGTGIIWGRPEVWPLAQPTIPTFTGSAYGTWIATGQARGVAPAAAMTPGGFHSFEHRWAVAEAFRFHQTIGKQRVHDRIHALNRQLKEGLAKMAKITLHTPMDDALSSGIVCFDIAGMEPDAAVEQLWERARIMASVTPYAARYVRLAPSLHNNEEQVERTLRAVAELA